MPVFRGGKIPESRRHLLGKEVRRERNLSLGALAEAAEAGKTRVHLGKREFRNREVWPADNWPLAKIKKLFPPIFKPIGGRASFIEEMFEIKGGKPVNVLDWGCGDGRAAGELAAEFGGKVKVYGFSKDSYENWRKAKGVKFIHAIAEDLPRYLKDGSIDLIYSHAGLINLLDANRLVPHIEKLIPKLSVGGKIVFTKTGWSAEFLRELQEKLTPRASVAVMDNSIYIAREY